jgi:Cohesin domain
MKISRDRVYFIACAMSVLLLYGCGGGGGGGSTPPSGPMTEVSVSPDSSSVNQGEEFTRTVEVKDAGSIYFAAFDITYDPKVIEFLGADEGSFFSQNQAGSTWFEAALENGKQGRLAMGITRLGSVGEVSGSGQLVTLHFKAVGPGTTSIGLSAPRGFKNSAGKSVAVSAWTDGTVMVQ